MGIDGHIANKIDMSRKRHEELSPLMENAHRKATKEVFSNPDSCISEKEFEGIYTPEAVARDLSYVKQRERTFEAQTTPQTRNAEKIADVFEAIIVTQSELSNWLGSAQTLKSSKFDDYHNGIDMIAEWPSGSEGSRVLALGVDVTYGLNGIQKKLNAIKERIDRDQLGEMRYFKDIRGDFMGTRKNIPLTLIGASESMVTELATLWVNNEKKALADHPMRHLITKEIRQQLLSLRTYAVRRDKQNAAHAYSQALAAMPPMPSFASIRSTDGRRLEEDVVAGTLFEELKKQFS